MLPILAAVTLLLIAGCSISADSKLAEQAVPDFHHRLDAGQFDSIYDDSAAVFQQAARRSDFMALLSAVHRKLGASSSSEEKGWNVNYNTSGTFVTLTYDTKYAEGEASEQFVYLLQDKKALLAGYHINSNALILK